MKHFLTYTELKNVLLEGNNGSWYKFQFIDKREGPKNPFDFYTWRGYQPTSIIHIFIPDSIYNEYFGKNKFGYMHDNTEFYTRLSQIFYDKLKSLGFTEPFNYELVGPPRLCINGEDDLEDNIIHNIE